MKFFQWFIAPVFLFSHLVADELFTSILEDQGVIVTTISSSQNQSINLLNDPSIPIIWGIAATSPSMHIGNLASLSAANQISKDGHPLIIIIDNRFAGLDPSGKSQTSDIDKNSKKTWSEDIEAQIKKIVGDNVQIYFSKNLDTCITLDELFNDVNLVSFEDRKQALSSLRNQTLRDFIYPLYYAMTLKKLASQLNLKKFLILTGEDQKNNAVFVSKFMKDEGLDVDILIHGLLKDSADLKISKSTVNAISITNTENIIKYIDGLNNSEITQLWYYFSTIPIPFDPEIAKNELKKIVIDFINGNSTWVLTSENLDQKSKRYNVW